jgi:diguanylate cyclase (GGDEF)-like protein/PAS domain S-box-containing protein
LHGEKYMSMRHDATFKAVFDQSPNAYLLITATLFIADANAAYLKATASRHQDIVGRYFFDLFVPDLSDASRWPATQLRAAFMQVLRTGQPVDLSLPGYSLSSSSEKHDGKMARHWSCTNTPIFQEGANEVDVILHHLVDNTENYKIRNTGGNEEENNNASCDPQVLNSNRPMHDTQPLPSKQRFQLNTLFEHAPGLMAMAAGPQHVFQMANAAYRRFVGRDDLIGKSVNEAMPELAAQGFIDLLDRVYQTGEPYIAKGVKILLHRQGSSEPHVAYLDFIYQPVLDASGSVVGIFCEGHDVTDWINAQEDLKLWKRALEAATNGIMITDGEKADQPIIYVNPSFERMTGYSSAELVGKNARLLQGQDRNQYSLSEIRDALQEGRSTHAVLRNYRKSGELFWNELFIAPVSDAEGRIRHFIGVQNDITQRKYFEDQIEHQVHHDVLTGLPNRVLMQDRLQQAIVHAQRDSGILGVFILDLDRFKTVNDKFGHDAGDELVRQVAKRLTTIFHAGDTVSRQGGDEFIIVLDRPATEQEAIDTGKLVIDSMTAPFQIASQDITVTCSVGAALFPRNGRTVEELIRNAEASMYQAKKEGGNKVSFYAPELNVWASVRYELESDMHQAISRQEFALNYQAQIEISSGKIAGLEALVRWQHPKLGLLAPGKFIQLAEETGLIIQIGEWALHEACRQAKQWQMLGLGEHPVSVNLSARQFADRHLLSIVENALASADLDARFLKLEITESLLMDDPAGATETLAQLRSRGVGLSIDDFGTGYSSLSYLKRFPLNELKIDKAFVNDIASSTDDVAIVKTIIALAHQLNLKVVAEGVETVEQLNILKAHGCDKAQGYLFSKPLPPAECVQLLKQNRDDPL